ARRRRRAPAGSRPADPAGAAPPPHERGRAARADQRGPRRHEPGRPAPAADGVPAALHARAGAAPRGGARHPRLGGGQRPQPAAVDAALRARRLVRRPPVAPPRSLDPAPDGVDRPRPGRRQPAGRGTGGAFLRERHATALRRHGGPPKELMPIIRPTLPEFREFEDLVRPSWNEGVVTTGRIVRAFEEEVCRQTGAREAVAMSSCTAGLMLAVRALE